MFVYLRTEFQGSGIILTSFRQGVILPVPPHTHTPQNEPLKSPPEIRVKAFIKPFEAP